MSIQYEFVLTNGIFLEQTLLKAPRLNNLPPEPGFGYHKICTEELSDNAITRAI